MTTEPVNFAWPVTATSKDVYDYFLETIQQLTERLTGKKIAIFGAGIRGTLLSILLRQQGYEDIVFSDNNQEKWGGFINQYPIVRPDEIYQNISSYAVFVPVEGGTKIVEQLKQAGFVLQQNLFDLNISLYDFYMKEFYREYRQDVLVLGDCGLTHISLQDENRDNLGTMLQSSLGKERTKVLAMHGMGLRSFYSVLNAQIHNNMKPRLLVLEVNFDVFTGKQHLLPRSQHVELLERVYQADAAHPAEFLEYIELARQRFQNFHAELYSKNKKTPEESVQSNTKLYMRVNYMYRLKEEIEPVVYLKKILHLAKAENIRVLPFIPPVNHMLAQELFGGTFLERYQDNLQKMKNILVSEGYTALDLSFLLTQNEFAIRTTADETANYAGRCKLCETLTKEIQVLLDEIKE